MDEKDSLLLFLARNSGKVSTTTSELAVEMRCSQQTVSRKLRDYEELGFIARKVTPAGVKVTLTAKGEDLLRSKYGMLKKFFENKEQAVFGSVITGLGEGKYYMALQGYKEQFVSKLGFEAYAGTLNLEVNGEEVKEIISGQGKILIEGFSTSERTFGKINCYKVMLEGVECAVIKPIRSSHSADVIEIIAPINLREKLSLKDGSIVKVVWP